MADLQSSNSAGSMAESGTDVDDPSKVYVPQFRSSASLISRRLRGIKDDQSSLPQNSPICRGESPAKETQRMEAPNASTVVFSGRTQRHSAAASSAQDHQDHDVEVTSRLKRKRSPQSQLPDFMQNTVSFLAASSPLGSGTASSSESPLRNIEPGAEGKALADSARKKRPSSMAALAGSRLMGFFAGGASDEARTLYFLGKEKSELMDLISFCDQVRPQLLVDVLVSVSKKHPDLPIFDSADWQESVRSPAHSKSIPDAAGRRPLGRPRHGHNALNPKARQQQKSVKKTLKLSLSASDGLGPPARERERVGVQEDVLPPNWPKAGSGMYAKLPLETEDRSILMDDGDDKSISQFVMDNMGKPNVISTCA